MSRSRNLTLGLTLFSLGCEPASNTTDAALNPAVDAPASDGSMSASDAPASDAPALDVGAAPQPIAAYDFTAGDITEPRVGVRWESHPESTAQGLAMTYRAETPDDDGGGPELRYAFPETPDLYQHIQLRVPMNFTHRRELRLEVANAAAIASWRAGDVVVGVDGASRGTVSFIAGAQVFLSFADNGLLNSAWVGSVRNETRKEAAVVVSRQMDGTNNKLWAIWMDEYSARGAGPLSELVAS